MLVLGAVRDGPAFLVVPNAHHRLDAKVWKDRYATMQVIAPEGARKEVDETVKVDAELADFGDASVRFVTVPGTQGREAALVVDRGSVPRSSSTCVNWRRRWPDAFARSL